MALANKIRNEIIKKLKIQAKFVFVSDYTASTIDEQFDDLRILVIPITESSDLVKNDIVEIVVYHKTHNQAQNIGQKIFNYFTYFLNGNITNLGDVNIKQIQKQADLQYTGYTREKGFSYKFSLLVKHTDYSLSRLKLS